MEKRMEDLVAGLDIVAESPRDNGRLAMIVCRPADNQRCVLDWGELDCQKGLIGDNWLSRDNANPDMQINIMNARAIELIAGPEDNWALAGDQLFIDLDLSYNNLPPGTRLSVGTAILEVTAEPHLGCKKFMQRFGVDAMKLVNSPQGKAMNLRGINARIVQSGEVNTGAIISKQVNAKAG